MITIQQYAEQKGVSHQAVYKQLKTHAAELKPYIVLNGRTRYLTDEAIMILDQYRETNPVILKQMDKDEKIEELENQVKQLLIKTAEQANRISELAEWKAEKALLLAGAEQNRLALEKAEKETKILEGFIQDAKTEIEILTEEKRKETTRADQLQAELDRERNKTFFQRLFGR